MAQATLVVGNMVSEALYVSSFHAECFSDAAYTQLVGSQAVAAVKNADGNWTQSDLISFPNLVRGNTYYIQAGPVSPGGVANFSRYSCQAGTLVIPDTSYSGDFTSTTSGVTYDITVTKQTVALNLVDHYEAIWTKDGSAPSNDSIENDWTGNPTNLSLGVLRLFVGGSPGQTVELFMRAVSTTGGYQNWVAVDSRMISNLPTEGTTDAAGIKYADGTTVEALKPAAAGADVTAANKAADTSAVNGINAGHIADSATSVGWLGKWWRTSPTNLFPPNGGELPYAPILTTNDAVINYNIWTYSSFVGASAGPPFSSLDGKDGKYIYVRWVGYYVCSTTGSYSFGTGSDDGANLYVNGTKIISDMNVNGHGTSGNLHPDATGTFNMTAGQTYEIVVEYYNNAGGAGIQVMFTPPGTSGWQLLNLGTAFKNAAFLQYTDGQTVDALQPAAAGADVTAVNVSKDTNAVNGTSSSHISDSVTSLGFVGQWYRVPIQPGVNAAPAAPAILTTHDTQINYAMNIAGQTSYSFAGGSTLPSPMPDGGDVQNLYARFTGYFLTGVAGDYSIGVNSDDGVDCWINGQGIIGNIGAGQAASADLTPTQAITVSLAAGANVSVELNYHNGLGSGAIQLLIKAPGASAYSILNVASAYTNATKVTYSDGSSVNALKPAQAGADQTASNTSLNTSNVGSLSAGNTVNLAQLGGVSPYEMLPNANLQSRSGWTMRGSGGVASYVTDHVYQGTQAVWLPGLYGAYMGALAITPFLQGHVYQVSAWIWTDGTSGGGIGVYLEPAYNPQATILATSNGTPNGGNNLGCYIPNGTAATGAYKQLQFTFISNANQSLAISVATSFGGSYTGNAWCGGVSCVDLTTANNANSITYTSGQTVQALQPAQAGADVTGSNTSNNTNNVGTVPASTISQVIPNGYQLIINSGNRTYSITAI